MGGIFSVVLNNLNCLKIDFTGNDHLVRYKILGIKSFICNSKDTTLYSQVIHDIEGPNFLSFK